MSHLNSGNKPYIPHSSLLSRTTTAFTTYDQSLSSFAPELLKHILAQSPDTQINAPYVITFESVGFFADVAGFTKATESLSNAMGDLGTEILAHKINSYLPHIARKIVGSGGDVVKFAGDALLCIWPPPSETIINAYESEYKKTEKIWRRYQNHTDAKKKDLASKSSKIKQLNLKFEEIKTKYLNQKFKNEMAQRESVKKNTFAAIQCAIEIQEQFGSMDLTGSYYEMYPKNKHKKNKKKKTRKRKNKKIEFRVKLGIGIGKIHLLIVGGALGRCEYLICGDGLIQAFDCENDCDPKEHRMIVVSEKVSKIEGINDNFLLKKIIHHEKNTDDKHPDLNNFAILGVHKKSKNRVKIPRTHYGHLIPDISNGLAAKLKPYIPAAVKPHLDMPQQIWTGELREVTIVFVSLPWNAHSFAKFTSSILTELQNMIYTLQSVIYKYQGSLNKFVIDDKGSTVMCVFGLPPVAHENDPARAVLAALELREKIGRKKQPAAIGVSCGTVFVGIIGSKGVRREYGILGDKVNLSARLMALSKKNPVKLGEVIVDSSVHLRARKEIRIEWTDLGWIWVKGKMDKVHIWRPSTNNIPISAHKIGQAVYLETSDKVSLKQIMNEIDIFKHQKIKTGKVILIEGEIGIGKTSLLGQIQVRNATFVWFLWGKANEFHECYNTPYIVWKQILLGFSSRFSLITTKNRYLFSLYIKQRRKDLFEWLFLINDLIDLGNYKLLEAEYMPCKYSLSNKNKLDAMPSYKTDKYRHDIIFTLLEWVARVKPIAIIIDELQYLTRKDWQITRRLCCLVKKEIIKNMIIFLGSTPIDNQRYRPLFKKEHVIDKYREIRVKYVDKIIVPSAWDFKQTKFFIKKYLDIGDVSQRVVMSIHSACGGRPGFCERFIYELTTQTNDTNDNKFIHVCKTKTDRLKNGNKQKPTIANDRNELYGAFDDEIDNRFKIGLDVKFPIPGYIMSITLAHCDKLNAEQSFILKVASIICKSKGNNSVQFEEHMLRGCHPLAETGMNGKQRLRTALKELCKMKFIKRSSIGRDKNDKMRNNLHFNKVPSYNNFDIDPIELKKKEKEQQMMMDINHVDLTEFDGITDPMPATKALLQEPSKSVPYKRGKMFKRGVNFINMTETQRIFVFKHRTLYWIKDEMEEYPRSRIKFDESVHKLKREDMRSCSIKTPRKEYILRCQKKRDMDQWFKLFKQALTSNYLSDALMIRMTNHTENETKKENKKVKKNKYNKRVENKNGNIKTTGASMDELLRGSVVDVDYNQSMNKHKKRAMKQYKPHTHTHSAHNGNGNGNDNGNKEYNLPQFDDAPEEIRKGVSFVDGSDEDEEDEEDDIDIDIVEWDDNDVVADLRQQFSNDIQIDFNGHNTLLGGYEESISNSNSSVEKKISPELLLHVSNTTERKIDDDEYDLIGVQTGDSMYEFSYGFLRDVVYEQMLHNQRKQLHTNALKYIAKCLKEKNNDKLALLHTRHIECVQRYADMLQGDDSIKQAFQPKRQSFFGRKAR